MKRTLLAVAIAAGTLASSSIARAEDPVVVERFPPTSVRTKLVLGGLAVTTLAWGVEFLLANQFSGVPGADAQKVPIAGPWIALGKSSCQDTFTIVQPGTPFGTRIQATPNSCGGELFLRGVGHVVDGLLQIGGLGLIAEGLTMTTESDKGAKKASAFTIRPTPIATPRFSGVGLLGTF